jgi:hypothetical protein
MGINRKHPRKMSDAEPKKQQSKSGTDSNVVAVMMLAARIADKTILLSRRLRPYFPVSASLAGANEISEPRPSSFACS